MSDEKSSKKRADMARRIWLAGIGAYGRAFEEGRDMMRGLSGDLSDKTSNAFDALAEKGEEIEKAAKMKGAEIAGKATSFSGDVQSSFAVDERIQAMRDRLSGGGSDARITALESRLERMEAKLDRLVAAEAARAKAPKRATTTRTQKTTTAKKPVAKKTTTKKTTAKKSTPKKSS